MSADLHPADGARSAPSPPRSRVATAVVLAFLRGHMIALSVLALLLLAYTLIGFLLVPRIARAVLQDYVTNTLHAQLDLGELRFNPFVLDASVGGAAIKDAKGAPLVGFRHLYVDAQLASIWRRGIVLREVDIAWPGADVVIARDGSVNLAQLAPPDDGEEEELTRVHIGRLAVRDGRITITDHTRARPFRAQVAPIRFTLTDFKTDSGYRNAYRFAGVTSSGEELEWSGGFTVQPLGSSGQYSVKRLKLATVDAYLGDSLPFQLASGEALVKGSYDLSLDPLTLEAALPLIAVANVSLRERGSDAAPPVTASSLEVQGVTFSLGQRKTAVNRIDIRGARIDAARMRDGSIDIMRPLVAASESSDESAADSESAPEWSVKVNTIHLDGGALKAVDHMVTPSAQFELAPATITVTNWSMDPDATVHVETDIGVNGEGRVLANGDVKLEPLAGSLHLKVSDLPLPDAQPYLSQETSITLHSGALSAEGDLALAPEGGEAPMLRYTGAVSIANLRIADQHVKQDLLKWRALALTGVDFQQQPHKLTIDRIVARQPYASVIIAQDQTLNIVRAMERPAGANVEAADDTAEEAAADMPIVIRNVQVLDGAANFADYSIEPSFATAIMELNGEVKGLSSNAASRAQVKLAGKVDRYAPVDITGEVNLLAATAYTDLAMNFRNMELTTFNPYSGRFAGYNISRGKLSTELRYKIEDRKLAAEHHIVVDNLEFGAKTDSKDAAPIPIKLAVALLKDRNGVIDVELPVSGTLDDPKFRLGPIIWKAILGLLTKIVTAPFAALGALFGGGEELAYVDFPPGAAQLSPPESEKLSKLAKGLAERPQLRLNVPLTAIGTEDAAALARKSLTEKLPPEVAEADEPRRRKALENLYREQLKAAPEYPPDVLESAKTDPAAQSAWLEAALLAHLRPDDAALDALARERARAVQDALLANTDLNPERVFITNERTGAVAEGGLVRMEMKLE